MKREEKRRAISRAVGEIDSRYLEEAEQYRGGGKKAVHGRGPAILAAAAAVFLSVLAGGVSMLPRGDHAVVYAYSYGTDEKLTKAGVLLHTGTVAEGGEQTGHPLMFYLSGENIEHVRFSCKNQELVFTDWTEKRDEYGPAKNFTVPYGADKEEYRYLTIDWEPGETIRRLHEGCTIAELKEELKEDLIVMEITFADGKQAVKAIQVSLLADGTFFAAFDDYEIRPSDSFVEREDALTIKEQSQTQISRLQKGEEPENLGENGTERGAETMGEEGEREAARKKAEEYYGGTVFEVVSRREKSVSETEIQFEVSVKKDGILQEPDRTILLQKKGEKWEVVNEGY